MPFAGLRIEGGRRKHEAAAVKKSLSPARDISALFIEFRNPKIISCAIFCCRERLFCKRYFLLSRAFSHPRSRSTLAFVKRIQDTTVEKIGTRIDTIHIWISRIYKGLYGQEDICGGQISLFCHSSISSRQGFESGWTHETVGAMTHNFYFIGAMRCVCLCVYLHSTKKFKDHLFFFP